MKNLKELNILLVVFSLVLFGITSCDQSLQEEVYSFQSKQNFYQSAADAEAAIVSIYSGATSNDVYGRFFYDLLNLTGDQATIHRNPTFIQMDNFNYSVDHPYILDFWEGLYRVISRANVAIERIPDIEMQDNLKNSYIAEARFLRASMYFHLVRLWGDVPLSLEEIGDEESAHTPLASVNDIYTTIIEDLEFAEQHLPITREDSEFGRVTKGAAKVILTDVYLTRENWSMAASKAKEIIDSNQYTLLNEFEDIFAVDNEANEEIIHSIIFDGNNVGNFLASFGHAGGPDNAMAFEGAQVWQVDEKSHIWLNWNDQDKRKDYSIYTNYLSESGDTLSVYDTSRPYPAFGKWNAPNETSTGACPLNYIVYRYADVLLMYAEALSQQNGGPNQAAYEAINKVIRRGYGLPINESSDVDLQQGLDAQSFQDSVITERGREFLVEGGKRLLDLMRTNQFPQKLIDIGKDNVNTNAKLFPIPQAEIDANDHLSEEDQNEGY